MAEAAGAFLSEEARLKAQRRMLAERYGLEMSDDDDTSGNEDDDGSLTENAAQNEAGRSSPAPRPSKPTSILSRRNGNGQPSAGGASGGPRPAPQPVAGTNRVRVLASPARDAGTPAGTLPRPSPRRMEMLQIQGAEATDGADAPVWPGVVLSPIPRLYAYDRDLHRTETSKRQLRVTQVTVYHSQLVARHARKIAVNDRVITYAVGGHIRAIARSTGSMALLKAHESAVADLELLGNGESRLSSGSWAGCSILGSVAEDGAAYVWRIFRGEGAGDQFEVGDAIPIFHPNREQLGRYSRLAFRPGKGSVVVDIGVGVCVCLVDPASPDLRIAEMVKMNGNTMLRDKQLCASEETAAGGGGCAGASLQIPVCAVVWVNERCIALARGAIVHLWDFASESCIGRLPRISKTVVHSLHAVRDDVLLVAADDGGVLEFWDVGGGDLAAASGPKFRLTQCVNLAERKNSVGVKDAFQGVVAIDPNGEVIVVANAKDNFLFALHYNETAKAVDAISEVPTRHPVLSLCVTRDEKNEARKDGNGVDTPAVVPEIGLWCVQPNAVQLLHLNASNCAPSETPSAARNVPALGSPAEQQPGVCKPDTGTAAVMPRNPEPVKPQVCPPAAEVVKQAPTTVGKTELQPASVLPRASEPAMKDGAGKEAGRIVQHANVFPFAPQPKPAEAPGSTGSSQEAPRMHSDANADRGAKALPAPRKEDGDIAAAVLEATKKAIDAFERSARETDAAENERVLKLIGNVKADAEKNLASYVTNAMKKPMGEAIIPVVSKIVTEMRNVAYNAVAERRKVGQNDFADAFRQCRLDRSFKDGCDEITEQVKSTINRPFPTKRRVITDALDSIVGDVARMTTTVDGFVSSLDAFAAGDETSVKGKEEVVEVDVRVRIAGLIDCGKVNEAFMLALNCVDIEIVQWLCSHFDPKTFFETNVLEQSAVLSLANQLGQALGEEDHSLTTTVKWLRELVLVLEVKDDAIVDVVGHTLAQLRANVGGVQGNKEVVGWTPGLAKELKTLGLLLTSLVLEEDA